MTVARVASAPGKLVLSGAYAVLYGAPAIVTAVDRRATAYGARPATHVSDEAREAVRLGVLDAPCLVDVSPLRTSTPNGSRKLGLGSSSALLVATLLAKSERYDRADGLDREALVRDALLAHRAAQGGGSGIDVASAVHGSTLACRRDGENGSLTIHSYAWPADARVVVFAASESAVTSSLVRTVREFARANAAAFDPLLARVHAGANAATRATSAASLIAALTAQVDALTELGDACGAPIVPASQRPLRALARDEHGHMGPSGAGGGDVVIFVGVEPPSPRLVHAAASVGLSPLPLTIGAAGARIEPNGGAA